MSAAKVEDADGEKARSVSSGASGLRVYELQNTFLMRDLAVPAHKVKDAWKDGMYVGGFRAA